MREIYDIIGERFETRDGGIYRTPPVDLPTPPKARVLPKAN
jgi:hypothetical protein